MKFEIPLLLAGALVLSSCRDEKPAPAVPAPAEETTVPVAPVTQAAAPAAEPAPAQETPAEPAEPAETAPEAPEAAEAPAEPGPAPEEKPETPDEPAVCTAAVPDLETPLPAAPAPAAEPMPAEEAAPAPAPTSVDLTAALSAELERMLRENDEDFYNVAVLLTKSTGNWISMDGVLAAAAEKGEPVSQYWTARRELDKRELKGEVSLPGPDFAKALKLLRASASRGYLPACIACANLIGSGIGCEANREEALRYLQEACKKGSARARAIYMMVSGRIDAGKFDTPEMKYELDRGRSGSASAAFRLAVLYSSEESGDLSEDPAPYLKLATERHWPEALCMSGKVAAGQGDAVRTVDLLAAAAQLGSGDACRVLAEICGESGGTGITPELITGLMQRSFELGDLNGTAGYAYCRVLASSSPEEAAKWLALLKQSADSMSVSAYKALASLNFNGAPGVAPDMRRAVYYLGEARSLGYVQADALIAALAALGCEGTPPDASRAEAYLKIAVDSLPISQQWYDQLLKEKGWTFLRYAKKN